MQRRISTSGSPSIIMSSTKSSDSSATSSGRSYPAPAYLNFCPGGISAKDGESEWYELASYSNSQQQQQQQTQFSSRSAAAAAKRRVLTPEILVAKAKAADDRLRQYCLFYSRNPTLPYFLPSLSALSGAAFGRLTGVSGNSVRKWADSMIAQYLERSPECMPSKEEDIYDQKPVANYMSSSTSQQQETTALLLKRLLKDAEAAHTRSGDFCKPRPCGYVFKRGDIAWNCRTCQTDPTCVICDNCFHNSNHEGHEVYFHRTTPGGCCDCGDAEAWSIEGCCDLHRPTGAQQITETGDDPEEAVKMAQRGLKEGLDTLRNPPTQLPGKIEAALGVVVGGAVNCLVEAADGAGIGADTIQWKMRWADEACRIINAASNNEEYYKKTPTATLHTIIDGQHPLPRGYSLDLRLHNDDVHTFDEVIEALHESRHRRTAGDQTTIPLVAHRDDANEMTHHVDADGQVTVKTYANISDAMQGYRQLKQKGLHCAVVSSVQVDSEQRARTLTAWLAEIATAHPSAATIVVHALVKVLPNQDLDGLKIWHTPRMIPSWSSIVEGEDEITTCRRRFFAFPPHLESSYLTREEAETLHRLGFELNPEKFLQISGTDPSFYASVAYRLPSVQYRKSPHSLWGTLPATFNESIPVVNKHQLLYRTQTGQLDETAATMPSKLSEQILVVDTDLRKQQESDLILSSIYTHKIPGLNMVSGVGSLRTENVTQEPPLRPDPMEWRNVLATCSFRAPVSPIVLLLLLDPYPTKQLRGSLHALFLSLLIDSRFKCRFAAALGAVAYRPLSTLFCAGVGTETDTPLGFTVQIFTAGSLVRALGNATAAQKLLKADQPHADVDCGTPIGVFSLPIAHAVLRCIHTNLLGSTKEVNMILKNTRNTNEETMADRNDSLLPALTYQAGEHPLSIQLPAAPDDGFLDSRSTRHKRLPHLLRDLEYITETPGTAFRLLLPQRYPVKNSSIASGSSSSSFPLLENCLTFPSMYARLLRTAQGMDPQKRKISGGHVEYEQNRWLEAFGLSLNFAGTRDALSESLTNSSTALLAPFSENGSHLQSIREAMGNLFAALLRELKLWLYREGMLETGLPYPQTQGNFDHSQVEALQRSTLHVSSSQIGDVLQESSLSTSNTVNSIALSCATGVKMTEAQLDVIENSLRLEGSHRQIRMNRYDNNESSKNRPAMGDWLRIPHSPLGGDTLSFHLPLHRSIAKCIRSICYIAVPESIRRSDPNGWWKLPVLDDVCDATDQHGNGSAVTTHSLAALIRPTLRSSNCRVVWSAGPDCTSSEAQRRRSRAKNVSATIASAKIIHSLADHPLRCLAAAQQIERHLWARNGSSTAGMALNYSSSPLCRSFRDLDITLVQLSAAGLGIGLGARRMFSLLTSRFDLDGYLCDPERRPQGVPSSPTSTYSGVWVNPPRLQDPEHAVALSDSFFTTLCILVTELPSPPPSTPADDSSLRSGLRRELLHALAAEPRSHSEAMEAATSASSRRDESAGISGGGSGGGALGDLFTVVLRQVGSQKNQSSTRAASGPSAYELKAECCDEYDPSFYHLRRQDHQHAMDTIGRLRKAKASILNKDKPDRVCLPMVCAPPKAHPRFLPCRLVLHLPAMDAALRRCLLFAITGGKWLPPEEPTAAKEENSQNDLFSDADSNQTTSGIAGTDSVGTSFSDRRAFRRAAAKMNRRSTNSSSSEPFSAAVIAASSVSCLEVLQLLTLQVHTLEECASLHLMQPTIDDDAKALSSSLSINRYLGRLIHIPESLTDAWALQPHPKGPLPSKGSGKNRGSILGLLVALYEHRSKHGGNDASQPSDAKADEGHGGARALTENGLKWLLRFVHALVDGAPSVKAATRSATLGIPIRTGGLSSNSAAESTTPVWAIVEEIRETVTGMLQDIPDLWPKEDTNKDTSAADKENVKNKQARKAAQQRVMEMMRKKQVAFAETIAPTETEPSNKMEIDNEGDLCIICRCDDTDGENNGPLGYLGHVQRSRYAQMRACNEISPNNTLYQTYRVAGHRGCQLRKSVAMDSEPMVCLPTGSIVTVNSCTVSDRYDLLSRRVFVRHCEKRPESDDVITEGWASVQSSEGYVILSPLSTLCFSNTRWGSTRPVILQCGHAAHLKCVETHTLSLHQRSMGEQPYDGRFAANIEDREFLCPLCKQLSNILIPRDGCSRVTLKEKNASEKISGAETSESLNELESLEKLLCKLIPSEDDNFSKTGQQALKQFGDHLTTGMTVPWDRVLAAKKRKQARWNKSIQQWDYEDTDNTLENGAKIKNLMSLLRQQHIAWSALGHSAASKEAATRSVLEETPFGVLAETSDPWTKFTADVIDTHPRAMELRRTMAATSGLFDILLKEMGNILDCGDSKKGVSVIGSCLSDILFGNSWMQFVASRQGSDVDKLSHWSQLTALIAAMPCHVVRDGMLSMRHEARACAAAMWTVKGSPVSIHDNEVTKQGTDEESSVGPPTPYAIRQIMSRANNTIPTLKEGWGTLDPACSNDTIVEGVNLPFRPAIASAFLYVPLLAWDLNTFAGAIFSTILGNGVDALPTSSDLLFTARLLLVGRLIQCIVTPFGFEIGPEDDDEDYLLDFWLDNEIKSEGEALSQLFRSCTDTIKSNSSSVIESTLEAEGTIDPSKYHGAIGRAILPFGRSLVLLLRACSSAIRQRQKKGADEAKVTSDDKKLEKLIVHDELMTYEDGLLILRELGGPLPSLLVSQASKTSSLVVPWKSIIQNWLTSLRGFEKHHGSRGNSIISELDSSITFKSVNFQKSKQDDTGAKQAGAESKNEGNEDQMMEELEGDQVQDLVMDAPEEDMEETENLLDDMDMEHSEEEMVGFAESTIARNSAGAEAYDDSSEDGSLDGSTPIGRKRKDREVEFVFASRSPIIPHQPSLLGKNIIGPGTRGASFEIERGSAIMRDLSHLGMIHGKDKPTNCLIRLPENFVELYGLVNKVKGRDGTSIDENDDSGSAETAICLLTGSVMRSGSPRRSYNRSIARPPGTCTLHARQAGSGIGIFFLVQKCTVLLMHNNKSAYSASVYVDQHGEEDPGLRRGRPLFLNKARYKALETLWRHQGIPREVAQIRSTSDRVIRDNWY